MKIIMIYLSVKNGIPIRCRISFPIHDITGSLQIKKNILKRIS